jgi:hypothetical protein
LVAKSACGRQKSPAADEKKRARRPVVFSRRRYLVVVLSLVVFFLFLVLELPFVPLMPLVSLPVAAVVPEVDGELLAEELSDWSPVVAEVLLDND